MNSRPRPAHRVVVANMASYAICSSLILVIHDNMTNETNHIVQHVFVDPFRSQGWKNTTCQNEKKRKDTVGWTDNIFSSDDILEEGIGATAGWTGILHEEGSEYTDHQMNRRYDF
jgi:hypothetical protein